MKPATLQLLACPNCHGSLAASETGVRPIQAGMLACARCQKTYAIVDGIPHFLQFTELTGLNRRFARLYDWFSWIYVPFSRLAFAYIGMSEAEGRHEILDRLEPCGGRVLEISIGPGVNLPYLVSRPDVGDVVGLDISLGQLRRCQTYTRRLGWAVDLVLGNAEQLPFGEATFDAVFHIGGINFFNDKQAAIREMIRVAKPGTRLIIADETEKGALGYEKILPGFKSSFGGQRAVVQPPIDWVPSTMQETRVVEVWKGWFYALEFRKPRHGLGVEQAHADAFIPSLG